MSVNGVADGCLSDSGGGARQGNSRHDNRFSHRLGHRFAHFRRGCGGDGLGLDRSGYCGFGLMADNRCADRLRDD